MAHDGSDGSSSPLNMASSAERRREPCAEQSLEIGSDSPGAESNCSGSPDLGDRESSDGEWRPGYDATPWIRRGAWLHEQAQVLMTNVLLSLRRVPGRLLRPILPYLAPSRGIQTCGSFAEQVAAATLRMSRSAIRNTYSRVVANGWQPLVRQLAEEASVAEAQCESDGGEALRSLIRLALGSAVEGRSGRACERDVVRCGLADARVGGKMRSRHFAREVEYLAALVVRHLDAEDFNADIPGLGIPSDMGLLLDPVTMGTGSFARHDTLLMLCLSIVSVHNGSIYTPMLGGPAMSIGAHGGQALCELALWCLKEPPAAIGEFRLRASLAVVGGDGQVVLGGPDHRHSSSRAAELLWHRVHFRNGRRHDPPEDGRRHDPPEGGRRHDPPEDGRRRDPPVTCTAWDPFHRVDVACTRAVRRIPAAAEVFDVAKTMDALFGIGEGRLICRGVAQELGAPMREVRGPGGTRKVVYLSGVPGNLLENYQLYVTGLHVRTAWRREGHSAQTLEHLTAVGRRLSTTKFATFLLLFQDVLVKAIKPYALLVQGPVEPSVGHAAGQRLLSTLRRAGKSISAIRRLLTVVVLCRQHVGSADLLNLVAAFACSSAGRAFPALFSAASGLLARTPPSFQRCYLQTAPDDSAEVMTLGPHCQCLGREQHPRHAAARPRVSAVQLSRYPRRVAMPWWVTAPHGGQVRTQGAQSLLDIRPRYQARPRSQPAPVGVLATNMFRRHLRSGTASRCQVPRAVYAVHAEMDDALRAASEFLHALHDEVGAILGSVGMNDAMRELLAASACCWDWRSLIHARPGAEHVRAFQRVSRMLRPYLAQTLWPGSHAFAKVEQAWPSEDVLAAQYMRLALRVREAAAAGARKRNAGGGVPPPCAGGGMTPPCEEHIRLAEHWVEVKGYSVRPIWSSGEIMGLSQQWFKQHQGSVAAPGCRAFVARIAQAILRYVGDHPGVQRQPPEAKELVTVLGSDLRVPGSRRRRMSRKQCQRQWHLGDVAVLAKTPDCRHHNVCVEVVAVEQEVAVAAVASAIDTCTWFALGGQRSSPSAWHAARVHHRCRLLFPPESACERLGSRMTLLWSPWQGLSAGPLADRVFLAQAQVCCLGGERDEFVVAEVASLLQALHKHHLTPLRESSARPRVLQQVLDAELALRASGRNPGGAHSLDVATTSLRAFLGGGRDAARSLRAMRDKEAVPSTLPPSLAQVVRRTTRDGMTQAVPEGRQRFRDSTGPEA